jgi:hypothetical protein
MMVDQTIKFESNALRQAVRSNPEVIMFATGILGIWFALCVCALIHFDDGIQRPQARARRPSHHQEEILTDAGRASVELSTRHRS